MNPPLLRSGIQNACTYSDTGCAGGSICAADAAAYIPVNTDAKVSTTQKDHPVGWSFCVVETTGTILPISAHFNPYLHFAKNHATMRVFALFHVCARNHQNANFQKFRVRFVYGSMCRSHMVGLSIFLLSFVRKAGKPCFFYKQKSDKKRRFFASCLGCRRKSDRDLHREYNLNFISIRAQCGDTA